MIPELLDLLRVNKSPDDIELIIEEIAGQEGLISLSLFRGWYKNNIDFSLVYEGDQSKKVAKDTVTTVKEQYE